MSVSSKILWRLAITGWAAATAALILDVVHMLPGPLLSYLLAVAATLTVLAAVSRHQLAQVAMAHQHGTQFGQHVGRTEQAERLQLQQTVRLVLPTSLTTRARAMVPEAGRSELPKQGPY